MAAWETGREPQVSVAPPVQIEGLCVVSLDVFEHVVGATLTIRESFANEKARGSKPLAPLSACRAAACSLNGQQRAFDYGVWRSLACSSSNRSTYT